MEKAFYKKCPQCGRTTKGTLKSSWKKDATKMATDMVLKKGITVGVSLVPGVGPLAAAVIGGALGGALSDQRKQITDSVANSIHTTKHYDFLCSGCGSSWSVTLQGDEDTVTDAMLQVEKQKAINKRADKMSSASVKTIICTIISIICIFYCITAEASHIETKPGLFWGTNDVVIYNLWWYFSAFVGFFTIIGFFINLDRYSTNKTEKDEITNMTLEKFRYSIYRK